MKGVFKKVMLVQLEVPIYCKILQFYMDRYYYSHAPHNDISVNGRPHIQQWSHKIMIV